MNDDDQRGAGDSANAHKPPPQDTPSPETPPPQSNKIAAIINLLKANKVDGAMLATRLLTIVFTFAFFFMPSQSTFNKALLSNAATSALRLHQRLPTFAFTRQFLTLLLSEDSCHYLMYSIIFLNVHRNFLILMPITLFAILHCSSYVLKLLDSIGQNSLWFARFLISLVEFQAGNILKGAAFSEIFLMPIAVIMTFLGRAGLMTPIVYYHFLMMRYSSRRNPYTRNAFTALRMFTESWAHRSPAIVAKLLNMGIRFVSRLAPQLQPQPAE